MSLDLNKLENLKKKSDHWQARCPACAKAGADRKGEHLFLASDGKYGCVAHQDDKAHSKEIYRLAGMQKSSGQSTPIPIRIRRPACATRVSKTILVLKSLTTPTAPSPRPSEEPAENVQQMKSIPENNPPSEAPGGSTPVAETQDTSCPGMSSEYTSPIYHHVVLNRGKMIMAFKDRPGVQARIQACVEGYAKEGSQFFANEYEAARHGEN